MVGATRKHAPGISTGPEEELAEGGDIYFAYRPRIGEGEAHDRTDIQRFFMVLKPEGKQEFRLAVLGRKRLPDARRHERIWGFIERVARSGAEIEGEFKEQRYETKTRGERTLPAVRPAGEGIYALIRRGRNLLHLVYELELPERPGEVQAELNIPRQGAYILSIKNPEKPAPPGAGLPERDEAHYPKPLRQEFHGRRFAAEDPKLLDYQGAEFILIGARTNPERAYAIDIESEHETAETADIFRQLKMSRGEHPLDPLLNGRWR